MKSSYLECAYRNCNFAPAEESEFCSPACERYYYRETDEQKRAKATEKYLVERIKRRQHVYRVLTSYWKNCIELYKPLRVEGYEATLKTLKRDLDALVDQGVAERRMPLRQLTGNPSMEYRRYYGDRK